MKRIKFQNWKTTPKTNRIFIFNLDSGRSRRDLSESKIKIKIGVDLGVVF